MPAQARRRIRRNRSREVARGLCALAGLLLVVVGLPVVLWEIIGWPLPHALPSLSELGDALTRPTIPDEVFPKALAVLAWVVWAQFVSAVVAEAAAAMRGTMPAPIFAAGWGVQATAGRLVATALLLLPSPILARPAAASLPRDPAPVVREVTADPSAPLELPIWSRPARRTSPDRRPADSPPGWCNAATPCGRSPASISAIPCDGGRSSSSTKAVRCPTRPGDGSPTRTGSTPARCC